MSEFENMTLEQYEKYWLDKQIAILGSVEAKKLQSETRNHYLIMKQLWMSKGFKKYGEYERWGKDHKAERNAYFRERGDNSYDRKVQV